MQYYGSTSLYEHIEEGDNKLAVVQSSHTKTIHTDMAVLAVAVPTPLCHAPVMTKCRARQ